MASSDIFRRLRGAFGNALAWGVGWFVAGFAVFTALRVTGIIPAPFSWLEGLGLAIRMGIIGGVAGGAFSVVIRLLYHGRRLSGISWLRFGIGGGIVTGLFVPLFLLTMNVLSGDGILSLETLLRNGFWTAMFGGAAAGGSLRLAQLADKLSPGRAQDRLDPVEGVDRPPDLLVDARCSAMESVSAETCKVTLERSENVG